MEATPSTPAVETTSTAAFTTKFAPMLLHHDGVAAIEFYKKAFGAVELRRWSNPDGTVHVAELSIEGAMFHIREQFPDKGQFSPATSKGITAMIGLFVADPVALFAQAIAAGATEVSPVQDFDYGYRQGSLQDPFGHTWILQRQIAV